MDAMSVWQGVNFPCAVFMPFFYIISSYLGNLTGAPFSSILFLPIILFATWVACVFWAHVRVSIIWSCPEILLFLGHCHRRARQRGSSSLWKWVSTKSDYGATTGVLVELYLLIIDIVFHVLVGSPSRCFLFLKCSYHPKTPANTRILLRTKKWRYLPGQTIRRRVVGGLQISRWVLYYIFAHILNDLFI